MVEQVKWEDEPRWKGSSKSTLGFTAQERGCSALRPGYENWPWLPIAASARDWEIGEAAPALLPSAAGGHLLIGLTVSTLRKVTGAGCAITSHSRRGWCRGFPSRSRYLCRKPASEGGDWWVPDRHMFSGYRQLLCISAESIDNPNRK